MSRDTFQKYTLPSNIQRAMLEGDYAQLEELLKLCDSQMRLSVFVKAIYNNKKKLAECAINAGLEASKIIKPKSTNLIDVSTPIVDVVRRGYFDLALSMLNAGAEVDFKKLSNINDLALYEMLLVCSDEWKLRVTDTLKKLADVRYDVKKNWFFFSIENGDLEMCQFMISAGVYPDEISEYGESPLQIAIRCKEYNIARFLLSFKPNINIKTKEHASVLHLMLREYAESDVKYKKHSTQLYSTMRQEQRRSELSKLAKENVSLKIIGNKNSIFISPQNEALSQKEGDKDLEGGFLELFNALALESKLLNQQDYKGMTPLHLAILTGNVSAATTLLSNDSNPNVRDKKGRAPLFYAKSEEMIKLLKKHGAQCDIHDFDGLAPYEYLLSNELLNAALNQIEIYEVEDTNKKTLESVTLNLLKKNKLSASDFARGSVIAGYEYSTSEEHGGILSLVLNSVSPHDFIEYLQVLSMNRANFEEREFNGVHVIHKMINLCLEDMRKSPIDRDKRLELMSNCIILFLDNGVQLDEADLYGMNVLHKLCSIPRLNVCVNTIMPHIKPSCIDMQDIYGNTPIHYLIYSLNFGDKDMFELMNRIGKPNVRTKAGTSYIHLVCSVSTFDWNECSVYLDLLIEKGGDVNIQDLEGKTALHHACEAGNHEAFFVLVKNGAKLDAHDNESRNVLHYAAKGGSHSIIRELVECGVDKNKKDKKDKFPIDYLLCDAHGTYKSVGCNKEGCVRLLLPDEYNINEVCPFTSATKFLKAIKYADDELVLELFGLSPRLDMKDNWGLDPLAYSILYGKKKVFFKLLSLGECLHDTKYPNGETLLHFASVYNGYDDEIIKYLISKGYDPCKENSEGLSPVAFSFFEDLSYASAFYFKEGYDINPRLRQDTISIHSNGVLSNNYEDVDGTVNVKKKLRIPCDSLLSYVAVNSEITAYVKLHDYYAFGCSEPDYLLGLDGSNYDEIRLFKNLEMGLKQKTNYWAAAQYAAFYGKEQNLEELRKMGLAGRAINNSTTDETFKYYLRYS